MWSAEYRIETSASPATIWGLWSDVANWNQWDTEIVWSRLNGEFKAGTWGEMQPKGGPKTRFIMLEAIPEHTFTDRTSFPLAKLDFIHTLTPAANGRLTVQHRIEFSGLLSGLFARLLGKNLEKGLPHAVDSLVNLAETSDAARQISQ